MSVLTTSPYFNSPRLARMRVQILLLAQQSGLSLTEGGLNFDTKFEIKFNGTLKADDELSCVTAVLLLNNHLRVTDQEKYSNSNVAHVYTLYKDMIEDAECPTNKLRPKEPSKVIPPTGSNLSAYTLSAPVITSDHTTSEDEGEDEEEGAGYVSEGYNPSDTLISALLSVPAESQTPPLIETTTPTLPTLPLITQSETTSIPSPFINLPLKGFEVLPKGKLIHTLSVGEKEKFFKIVYDHVQSKYQSVISSPEFQDKFIKTSGLALKTTSLDSSSSDYIYLLSIIAFHLGYNGGQYDTLLEMGLNKKDPKGILTTLSNLEKKISVVSSQIDNLRANLQNPSEGESLSERRQLATRIETLLQSMQNMHLAPTQQSTPSSQSTFPPNIPTPPSMLHQPGPFPGMPPSFLSGPPPQSPYQPNPQMMAGPPPFSLMGPSSTPSGLGSAPPSLVQDDYDD